MSIFKPFKAVRPVADKVKEVACRPYDVLNANEARDEEIIDYTRAIGEVCKITGVQPSFGGTGFRSIANAGPDAIQEVPHFHTHIIGGRNLGRMVSQT